MFEVTVNIIYGSLTIPVVIATFDGPPTIDRAHPRLRAVAFAKQIDPGFAVDVINTEHENNRDKAFGLVYHHDARLP